MSDAMIPILKWAGGKRQLLPVLIKEFPTYDRYVEPFLGGGAVLFALAPKKAIVNDINPEIINLYKTIKRAPHKLISFLKVHKENHSKDYFYKIRNLDRDVEMFKSLSTIERAARTLYLNRTCFNGLFRVNRNGFFNTPIGKYKNPNIVQEEMILTMEKYFRENNISFFNDSYEMCLSQLNENDFVYFDPPYDAELDLKKGMFTAYTSDGFSRDAQIKLKDVCDMLTRRNIKFVQSNSNTSFIRALYKDYKIKTITVSRMINSKATSRKASAEEVIIKNF